MQKEKVMNGQSQMQGQVQSQLQVPFWYQVKNRKFSYKDVFAQSLNNVSYKYYDQNKYVLFFLCCLFNHNKYIDSIHIIQLIIDAKRDNTHQLSSILCLYFFILFNGTYIGENITDYETYTIGKHTIILQEQFDVDLFTQWMHLILTFFFDIGPLNLDFNCSSTSNTTSSSGTSNNNQMAILKAIEYNRFLDNQGFDLKNKTVNKFHNLQIQHENMLQLVDFYQGKSFPKILLSYRDDVKFFTSVVYNFWPKVLFTLQKEKQFNENEIVILRKAHSELCTRSDCDFLFDYIEEFVKVFGKEYILSIELLESIKPSPEQDAMYASNFLKKLTEKDRKKYLYQKFPVSEIQVDRFVQEIKKEGFEKVFKKLINQFTTRYKEDLKEQGYELINNNFFSNTENIFLYDLSDCYMHIEENNVYIFLPEEISYIQKKKLNPFTNWKIDLKIQEKKTESLKESVSIVKSWEIILRREITLD